jgi:hypothetical protein
MDGAAHLDYVTVETVPRLVTRVLVASEGGRRSSKVSVISLQ